MAKVLSGYRGLGKQTSSGVFRDSSGSSGSFVGGVPMAQSATTSNGSDPQGVEFFVAVKMADQTIEANRSHFEYMIASYDLTSSVYTWNRVSTIDSSNGGAAVDWESITTDENSLTFYAITPHSVFGNKTIVEGANYVALSAGAAVTQVCDDIVITPDNDYNSLLIHGHIQYTAQSTGATTYARVAYYLSYINSAGTAVSLMSDLSGFRSGSYASQSAYSSLSFIDSLDPSMVDASGDWRLRLSANTSGSTTPLTTNRIKMIAEQTA